MISVPTRLLTHFYSSGLLAMTSVSFWKSSYVYIQRFWVEKISLSISLCSYIRRTVRYFLTTQSSNRHQILFLKSTILNIESGEDRPDLKLTMKNPLKILKYPSRSTWLETICCILPSSVTSVDLQLGSNLWFQASLRSLFQNSANVNSSSFSTVFRFLYWMTA